MGERAMAPFASALALTLACLESASSALPTHAEDSRELIHTTHRLPILQSLMTTDACHSSCNAKGAGHKKEGYLEKWLFDGKNCHCHILVDPKCGEECAKKAETHKDFLSNGDLARLYRNRAFVTSWWKARISVRQSQKKRTNAWR